MIMQKKHHGTGPDPLAAKLKQIRLARGWKPGELAKRAGYSLTSIYEWEMGDKWPSRRALLDWCQALDCELIVWRRDLGIRLHDLS
jgi:transcriptional regulator with XRE-family HTH domain